jgi:ubiquinone/menaquinone biosynthesis C-methylase UbiE
LSYKAKGDCIDIINSYNYDVDKSYIEEDTKQIMSRDIYREIAHRYALLATSEQDRIYKKFFRTLFRKNKVHTVLDCACGTGRDLHLFHALGYKVVGSDISSSMLAQARKSLQTHGIKIPLYKLDYRLLHKHFRKPFDAVVCLSSSILHMPNKKQVVKAFRSMCRVLTTTGILVLTQGTTDKQWKMKPRFILAGHRKDWTRIFVLDYLKKGARYNIVDIYHEGKKSALKIWSVDFPHMYLKDDYARLLEISGFRKIRFYGSFRFEPYNKKRSNRLITIAYK